MERAVNPQTGEVVFLVNNQWVPATQTAVNPKTGETAYLVGNQWQVVPGVKKTAQPVSEQIASPEEMLTPITESPEVQALREKTKEYEAGTNILERAGRDIKRGGLRALNILPALTAASRQKEIERIRRGEVGRTDPMTGEFIPLTPEEEEAAIATLQGAQREDLESVAKREAQARAIPGRPVTAAVGQAKTFGEALEAAGVDPLGAMAGFALESLPQMAPALAVGAATRQPLAAAAAMGGSSMASELGNSVFEYLSEQGVDVNDTNAVMSALDDPKMFKDAYDFAMKRAAIIGTVDAATAGLASKALVPKKLIGSPKAREVVNIAIAQPVSQMASGAGGEAAAQLATYGEIRKPGEVIAEMIGEGPTSIAETAAFGGRRIYEEFRAKEAAAEAEESKAPAERVEPTVKPTVEPEVRAEEKAEEPVVPAFDEEAVDIPAQVSAVTPTVDDAEVARLEAELAKVQRRQMDPTLSLDDPRLVEYQQQEAEIKDRLAKARGEAPAEEDLYGRLIKASPAELKTIEIPKKEAPDLYLRASEDENASPALIKKLTKIVNEMGPEEFAEPKAEIETPEEETVKAGPMAPPPPVETIMENFGVGKVPAQKYLDSYTKFYDLYNRFQAGEDIAQEYTDALVERNKSYQRIVNISRQNQKRAEAKRPEAKKPTRTEITKPQGLTVKFGNQSFPVSSIDDAQEKWIEFRDQTGAGVSQIGNGVNIIDQDGNFVARISYNGRVWDSPYDDAKVIKEAPDVQAAPPVVTPKQPPKEGKAPAKKPAAAVVDEQAAVNRVRQAAQKEMADAAARELEIGNIGGELDGPIKTINKFKVYKVKVSPSEVAWRVQSPFNRAMNRIGEGDSYHSNTGTANDKAQGSEPLTVEQFAYYMQRAKKERAAAPAAEVKVKEVPVTEAKKEEHVEAGEAESITKPVIQEAVQKGATKQDIDYAAMKRDIERQVDEAIAKSPYKTNQEWDATYTSRKNFVTFNIPGDGTFKVKNNKERLEDFKKRLTSAVKPKSARGPQFALAPADVNTTLRDLVDANDIQSAIEFAALKGITIAESKLDLRQKLKVQEYMEDPDAFEKKVAAEAALTETQRQAMAKAAEDRRLAEIKRRAEEDEKRERDWINARYDDLMIGSERTVKNILRTLTKSDADKLLDKIDTAEDKPSQDIIDELQKKAGTYIETRWKDFANSIDSPAEAAKVRKKLFEKYTTKEGSVYLHQLVEKEVDGGSRIITMESGERRLGDADGYLSEKKIGTIGMDYAGFLINQKKRGKEVPLENVDIKARAADIEDGIKNVRKERIETLATLARKKSELIKRVRNYGSDIETQRLLNELEDEIKIYRAGVRGTKEGRMVSAEAFLNHARDAMDGKGVFRTPALSEDVFEVIRQAYIKTPAVLEGLRLSIKTPKDPGGAAGTFLPWERVVRLYSGSSGVEDPVTIRHELMHSLEQMMPNAAKDAVVQEWGKALERAIKKHTDKRSQEYFHKVMDFLEKPSPATMKAATDVMPAYEFYQYINPSEYWAVNAEKLYASKLGTPWERFKKAIKKLFEGLKNVFGFNNKYAVHKVFDDLVSGEGKRLDRETLVRYLFSGKVDIKFLDNVEDVDKLLDKHNRPDAPLHPSDSVKDRLMNTYRNGKKIRDRIEDEGLVGLGKGVITGADRAITYARNKNVWYGSGLDQADFARYNGQLRDSQGKAVASIAVTNAIHAGHVGTQVMVQGKLEYNPKSQQFMAKKSDKSMANVLKEKAKLVDKLGAQRAANVIQAYFEAKRSRSIVNEFLEREQRYQEAIEAGIDPEEAANDLANIERAMSKVNMDDEQIDDFIGLENDYPELRAMMDNWTAVNQNQLDMSYFAGNLSKKRYEQLKSIKDYVPWYRIMEDQKDPHDFPTGGTTRTMTNVAKEKRFKAGEVELDIDDIVDNMIHNVMWMTKNTMRNYAANRVADEYGIRNEKGKLKVFPKEGTDSQGVKFNILRNGRRIVVGVEDPLIAESVLGMENVEIPMNKILSIMANGLRRSITLSGAFQLKQLFMDAPTAAWVSGVKNPFAVWGNTFIAFGKVLVDKDPIAQQLRQAGIGGFMSTARTPEKELSLEIGLLNKSMYARVLRVLDHIGDASDYAQRVAIYKQVLKETGDEAQALLQANNVIDFLKRGSGQTAQFLGRTVAFMNAYAQSIDVLATTLAGGSLKGMERKKAITRMAITGTLLSFVTLMYCFAVGDDEEYEKLDDKTKLRNFVIPGSKKYFGETVTLPMHTSASFFFKAIPELLYNTYVREGAKDEMDSRRFRRGLKEAFVDAMLGPNVVPTGAKPFIEIGLNKNFWSGTEIIPKGMEDLIAAEQYTAATSELGKVVSALTSIPGTDDKRILAPVEADHLMRGLFGSAAAMAMWGTNMLAGDRAESRVKDLPVIGAFVLPPVPRGREDLFYDLKDVTDQKYKTYKSLLDREKYEEADKYLEKNEGLIALYDYTSQMDTALKEINKEIRRIGTTSAKDMSPKDRREQMNEYGTLKGEILEGIEGLRKQAFD